MVGISALDRRSRIRVLGKDWCWSIQLLLLLLLGSDSFSARAAKLRQRQRLTLLEEACMAV